MTYLLQYGWYDPIVSSIQQACRRYVAARRKSIYYLRLITLGPSLVFLVITFRIFTRMVITSDPQKIVDRLTRKRYQLLMKTKDSLKDMETIHAHLTRKDAINHPLPKKIVRRMLVKDLSAVIIFRRRIMDALDHKLDSKDGRILKSLNHNDLWDSRAKAYAYKF